MGSVFAQIVTCCPARALGVSRARTQIPGRAGMPSPAIHSSSPRPRRGVRAHSPCHREFSHSWVKLSRALPKVRSDPGAATCVLQHGMEDPDACPAKHLPVISNASPAGISGVTRGDRQQWGCSRAENESVWKSRPCLQRLRALVRSCPCQAPRLPFRNHQPCHIPT